MNFNKVNKFIKLSFSEKLLFTEVYFTLVFSKLIILFIPLRKAAKYFGVLNGYVREELTLEETTQAERIKLFVLMASGNAGWNSVCLDQALATLIILRRRKLPSLLCLGVLRKPQEAKIHAHAWIVCGNKILIGGQRSTQYTIVAQFASITDK